MLLNRTDVKRYILAATKKHRPGWNCTRVAATTVAYLENYLKAYVDKLVDTHPTRGRTFQPPYS